jgi:hypothetical protein
MKGLDDSLPIRFYAHQQEQDLKTFIGFPSQIRFSEVLISQGVEYAIKNYDVKWMIERYKVLKRKPRTKRLLDYSFLTHELLTAPFFNKFKYMITNGEEILHDRVYENTLVSNPSIVLYSVDDFFMLPTEYDSYSQTFNP